MLQLHSSKLARDSRYAGVNCKELVLLLSYISRIETLQSSTERIIHRDRLRLLSAVQESQYKCVYPYTVEVQEVNSSHKIRLSHFVWKSDLGRRGVHIRNLLAAPLIADPTYLVEPFDVTLTPVFSSLTRPTCRLRSPLTTT